MNERLAAIDARDTQTGERLRPNEAKPEVCPTCKGSKQVEVDNDGPNRPIFDDCYRCGGTGYKIGQRSDEAGTWDHEKDWNVANGADGDGAYVEGYWACGPTRRTYEEAVRDIPRPRTETTLPGTIEALPADHPVAVEMRALRQVAEWAVAARPWWSDFIDYQEGPKRLQWAIDAWRTAMRILATRTGSTE